MEALKPRGYQLEMIDLSQRRNIVVAIPTGGGKTLIAARSIEAELERSGGRKRVWFLCPTVVLAKQQHIALVRDIPAIYECRLLTGEDNVDRWGSQQIWNRVLFNISLVICTYQVLSDALASGFVRLRDISLLVFDEAHNCNKGNPANRIMQDFYHPAKKDQQEVPRILGLTASLVGSDLRTLGALEANLDAICRTPKESHDEMLRHVHLPSLVPLVFPPPTNAPPSLLGQLDTVRLKLLTAGEADPYVIHLRSKGIGLSDIANTVKLEKALEHGKTWCIEQVKRIWAVAHETQQELGYWSFYAYLTTCLEKLSQLKPNPPLCEDVLRQNEIAYLAKAFDSIEVDANAPCPSESDYHSPKVNLLINALVEEMQPGVTGILFVKTRAAVKLLSLLLAKHPATRDILRIGTFVGGSSNQKGSQHISELIDGRNQGKTLDELRSGEKNLVIATSVVEEGIDISACNFVICFDPPNNLRAFIQRRGRARKEQSKYIIMFPEKSRDKIKNWQDAEEEMKKMYQDDMRQLRELEKLESEDSGYREFVVESTGAKLTLQDSVARLHHFCNRISSNGYSSREPVFVCTAEDGTERVRCKIHLPNAIHDSIRRHVSRESWRSERLARMDAAFEAVVALYHAELIDDHLVPLDCSQDQFFAGTEANEKRPNIVMVDEQLDLWPAIAKEWQEPGITHTCLLTVETADHKLESVKLVSSRPFPKMSDLNMHVDRDTVVGLQFQTELEESEKIDVTTANEITLLLLRAGFRNRVDTKVGFPILSLPVASLQDPKLWLEQMTGTIPGTALLKNHDVDLSSVGIVREKKLSFNAYTFHGVEDVPYSPIDESSTTKSRPMLRLQKLQRRTDFLHALSSDAEGPSSKILNLKPKACQADRLPAKWAQIAKFFPTIYHFVSIHWLADELRTSLLKEAFPKREHVPLVLNAISASRARSTTDYQRLEFLGDNLLKFYVTLSLVANHPLWHEGYLSKAKEAMVSNVNLAAVAQRLRLSRYILSVPFTGAKWRPHYIDDLLESHNASNTEEPMREMSTKVLADVVEALLGAAWLAGGEKSLLSCLGLFFPNITWRPSSSSLDIIRSRVPEVPISESYISPLMELIGHQFQKPALLLEAMTHPGYNDASTPSYQRLEFLGDALLDMIAVLRIWSHQYQLSERWMHRIRTATVNGPILSIAALSHEMKVETTKPVQPDDDPTGENPVAGDRQATTEFMEEVSTKSLVSFLKTANAIGIHTALEDLANRHREWGPKIIERLENGKVYPWTELAAFDPPKFVSDIVESVVAALVVDHGALELSPSSDRTPPVITFLNKLGLLSHLQRILDDAETTCSGGPYNVWHPMEEIGSLADSEPVQYKIFKTQAADPNAPRQGSLDPTQVSNGVTASPDPTQQLPPSSLRLCKIHVGDQELCSATGRTESEVKTRAAEIAVTILRQKRDQALNTANKRKRTDDTRNSDDSPLLPSPPSSELPSQSDSAGSSLGRTSSDLNESPTKKIKTLRIQDSLDSESAGTESSFKEALLSPTGGTGS